MYNYSNWIDETNPEQLQSYYERILQESGFIILEKVHHYFNPYGYTALYLLAESHFAIHTFPEENKSYIELSSCVKLQYDNFVNIITNEN